MLHFRYTDSANSGSLYFAIPTLRPRTFLNAIREFAQNGAVLLLGTSVGAASIIAIVAPKTSYDHLKDVDADQHVRELLRSAFDPIAVLLLVADGLAILGGVVISGVAALLVAGSLFSNQWTLASADESGSGPGEQQVGKTRRILAVSLTLVFSLVALFAAIMAVLNR